MLIHDAIAEYILTQGDTEVKECDLSKHLVDLTNQVNGAITQLEAQYSVSCIVWFMYLKSISAF